MKTNLDPNFLSPGDLARADTILRSCVHCGFCTDGCPTYQLLGDENDSPRGRIYLIKDMFETGQVDAAQITHLDRCLSCRNCETNCPSGVAYTDLLDIARGAIEQQQTRALTSRLGRWLLRRGLALPGLLHAAFGAARQIGRWPGLAKFLPVQISLSRASRSMVIPRPTTKQVLLLAGCVQKAATPNVNLAVEQLLGVSGIKVTRVAKESCCGALNYHLGDHAAGLADMRRLLHTLAEAGPDGVPIVSSASGCGVTLKDYPSHFPVGDPDHELASRIASRIVDVVELFDDHSINAAPIRVAVHTPCTLSSGQQLGTNVVDVLTRAGIDVTATGPQLACCGSAGTYSVLQPKLATALQAKMITALTTHAPEAIVTANIGCQMHLGAGTKVPVLHWAELLWRQHEALNSAPGRAPQPDL
ncbi:MAG: glycolate oxidase subunit GlcF [Gammaproteobacteria bacterium]|nr:glycolate oxidase subunit GlcF [Gammaproteobacteria bacterium]